MMDLAKLDSAYSYHKKRGVVLDMFKSKEFVSKDCMPSYMINQASTDYWNWILRRDIKLFHVTVRTFGADAHMLASYTKRHEQRVGHLNMAEVLSPPFTLYCKHLVHLTCNVALGPAFVNVLLNNPNLCTLDFLGLEEEHIESLKTIRLPKLTQLRFAVGGRSAELATAVLMMPARLLKLNIDTYRPGVAKLCPHLRSLSLDMDCYGAKVGSDSDLIEFTSHLPHLVNLQLMDMRDLNDVKLLAVVQNMKELRFLNLHFWGESNLTDAGIGHIAEHCAATLEVFGLTLSDDPTTITSVSLDHLRAHCTKLRQFRVKASFGNADTPFGSVTTLMVGNFCSDVILVRISDLYPRLEVLLLANGATAYTLPTLLQLC